MGRDDVLRQGPSTPGNPPQLLALEIPCGLGFEGIGRGLATSSQGEQGSLAIVFFDGANPGDYLGSSLRQGDPVRRLSLEWGRDGSIPRLRRRLPEVGR